MLFCLRNPLLFTCGDIPCALKKYKFYFRASYKVCIAVLSDNTRYVQKVKKQYAEETKSFC